MPFTINWEKKGVVRTFHGIVHAEEVLEADRIFSADPRSNTAQYQISDFTQGTPGIVDDAHIDAIAALDLGSAYSIPRLKVALVSNDPDVIELCQKYMEIMTKDNGHWSFKICKDMKDARNWVSK